MTQTLQSADLLDMRVHKGAQALARIVAGAKRTREDWREVGEGLQIGRDANPSNAAFKAWCEANGYTAMPGVRSDAMWLAKNWENVEAWRLRDSPRQPDYANPHDIRAACRKAGCEWATDTKRKSKGPTTWLQAIVQHCGGYPAGYSHAVLAVKDSPKRAAIAQEAGFNLPCKPEQFPAMLAALQRCIDRDNTAGAQDRIAAEVKTLPEKAQAKIERLAIEQANLARISLQQQFDARVAEKAEKERQRYKEAAEEADAKQAEYAAMVKPLDAWMTKDEFKLVLGCLHPDKEASKERKEQAFNIFKRLEQHVNRKINMRLGGW